MLQMPHLRMQPNIPFYQEVRGRWAIMIIFQTLVRGIYIIEHADDPITN